MELAHLHGVVLELLEQSLFLPSIMIPFYRVTGCCDCVNSRSIVLGGFALDKGYIQGACLLYHPMPTSRPNYVPQ